MGDRCAKTWVTILTERAGDRAAEQPEGQLHYPYSHSYSYYRGMDAVERVRAAMRELGLPGEVQVFAASTATAQEAADAVGCELGQIVKTLFFLAEGRPTVALVAGDRQVDTAEVARILGVGRKKLKMGSAGQVFELTGYAVGGVSPIGLATKCDVLIDDSLRRFEQVWAAAGAHNAVFPAAIGDLERATSGQWATITKPPIGEGVGAGQPG